MAGRDCTGRGWLCTAGSRRCTYGFRESRVRVASVDGPRPRRATDAEDRETSPFATMTHYTFTLTVSLATGSHVCVICSHALTATRISLTESVTAQSRDSLHSADSTHARAAHTCAHTAHWESICARSQPTHSALLRNPAARHPLPVGSPPAGMLVSQAMSEPPSAAAATGLLAAAK